MAKLSTLLLSINIILTVLLYNQAAFGKHQDSILFKEMKLNDIDFKEINLDEIYNDSTGQSLSFLSPYLKDKYLFALGEASHGTEEFYKIKSAIIKYLIKHEQFRGLLIEMDEYIARRINGYVRYHDTTQDEVKEVLKNYGLYNSAEFYDLLIWIKAFNNRQSKEHVKFNFIGFDNKEYWGDPFSRDKMMANNLNNSIHVLNQRYILWSHNSHVVKSNTWDITNSGVKSMGNYLVDYFQDRYFVLALDTYQGQLNTIEDSKIKAYDFAMEKELLNTKSTNFFSSFVTPNLNKSLNNDDMKNNDMKNNDIKNKDDNMQLSYNLTHLSSNLEGNPQKFPVILGKDIDALIFIKRTSASKVID